MNEEESAQHGVERREFLEIHPLVTRHANPRGLRVVLVAHDGGRGGGTRERRRRRAHGLRRHDGERVRGGDECEECEELHRCPASERG